MASKPKHYQVLLTQGAEQDLEALYDYIAEFDCLANANSVLDRQVLIYLIVDGRRDMQSLLSRRLLAG